MKANHRIILVTAVLTSFVWILVFVGVGVCRSSREPAPLAFIEKERFEFDGIRFDDRDTPWRHPAQRDLE